jgi:hypothetical protein
MNISPARLQRLLPVALALTVAALPAAAATWYVAPSGSDTAAGTEAAPFRTIQRGVNAASPGDTVLVASGVYAAGEQTTSPSSGKSRVVVTKAVTVRSTHGAASTVIRGQPHSATSGFGANSVRCVYMTAGTLDGFTLADGYANANASGSSMTDPRKNGGGVYAPDNNRAPQVNNCIITRCGAYRGGGAHWATLNNCTVVSNYVNTASGAGVFSCHVRNSIVQFNGASNDKNYPSEASSVDRSLFIRSCVSPASGQNFYGDVRDGGGNITDDPLFNEGTLSLSDASPCINAGANAYASGPRDAAGGARIQGGIVDMGAYERGSLFNTLTVVNGSGSGSYTNGAVVRVFAQATNAWIQFAGWTGDTATLANPASTNTTLVMPDRNITVTAEYQTLALDDYLSRILGIPLPVTTENVFFADVDPATPEVRLGNIGDDQRAFVETVYTNAGTLLFSWRVSTEPDYDKLRLLIDGHEAAVLSGTAVGVVTQFIAGAGPHTVRWEYGKDSAGYDGEDAAWVGAVTWIPEPLAAELGVPGRPVAFPNGRPGAPLPFPYGFEACFLDDDAPAGAVGGAAVKLGGLRADGSPLFADGTTNGVETVLHGAGALSFNWCTSNQPSDSVVCTIDGVEVARTGGTKNGWLSFSTNLSGVGAHTVRWSYTKNASGSDGADAAWIDEVTWTQDSHTLTVENGSGSGVYPVGATVAVEADPAPVGEVFATWDGDTNALVNPLAPSTTLTMPARDIAVRALYKTQTFSVTVINGRDAGAWPNAVHESTGEPEGAYPPGAEVRIVADPAPLWQAFDRWEASDASVFADAADALRDVTVFTMPSGNVTLTAVYRPQSEAEKLAGALTVRGQPLAVTDYSASGVAAVENGGIRYDDPVVRFGGPSVGPGQSVSLSTTNFTGEGVLLFWWHGDTEEEVDGLTLEVNGSAYPYVFSMKDTNRVDNTNWWALSAARLPAATTNVTWRYTRDDTYYVHQNMMLLDRVTWLPQALLDALGAGACLPNVNAEYDPLFEGRNSAEGAEIFDGEDGGVAWAYDAPGGGGAIRLGRFGYVTNNLYAQVAFTNWGTGLLTWEWSSRSEGVYDRLGLYVNGVETNWVSGKWGVWHSGAFAVTEELPKAPLPAGDQNIFTFRYHKDATVSMFEDCAWLRGVVWTPTYRLTVNGGAILTGSPAGAGLFPAGTPVSILADPPQDGHYFDRWDGTNVAAILGAGVTNASPTFPMPARDLILTATYTTNAPPVPHYALTVNGGSGSGNYPSGTVVPIAANAPPSQWHVFQGWSGGGAAIADPSAAATTVLIGTNALTVTAVYTATPVEELIQSTLGVPAPVTVGNVTASDVGLNPPEVALGPVGDSETAFFTTVYTNAGTVIFPWSVDSEKDYDFFVFSVDGTNVLTASGRRSGVVTNFVAGDGPHLLRWTYEKDFADLAGTDRATVGKVTWIPDALAAELGTPGKALDAPEGFDAVLLDTAPPAGAVGGIAARLGGETNVAHGASVTLGTVFSGSGKLSFHWRTSSESYDYLILVIDGQEAARISGTKQGWLLFETNLLAVAEHAVQWVYAKDASVSAGSDCGWIDSVTWTQFSYLLTVENGTGGGTNAVGATVAIAADPAPAGMEFGEWDGDIETLADPASAETTLVMPGRDITVRALYRQQTLRVTVINGRDAGAWPNAVHESTGEPEGAYPAGAEVRIVADPAPLWQVFDHWVSTNGAVFADAGAAITTFTMPANSVTVTAVYRPQSEAEKLAGALTVAGQPLAVTSYSPSGVVAVATGGVRHDDPLVRFGGPSVGAGQSAELTTTSFTGDGVLFFWWKGNAEVTYDRIEVVVNGSTVVGSFSGKGYGWRHATNFVAGASSITLRFQRDGSYYVRDNVIAVDRLIWMPVEMIGAMGCVPALPEVNGESDPSRFDGEDGGVAWVNDAPGGNGAIRFGRFGYVNNSQHAQLSVTNYGTGILQWQWTANNEDVADRLQVYFEQLDEEDRRFWMSGKEKGWWSTATLVVKNGEDDRETARKALRTFLFKYHKDEDVSVFDDCVWLRSGVWTPTVLLTLESATNTAYTLPAQFAGNAEVIEEAKKYNIFPVGTQVTLQAYPPEDGYYFDSWEGNLAVPPQTPVTITMPTNDVVLRATYTTNAPSIPPPSPFASARITGLTVQPSVRQGFQAYGTAPSSTPPAGQVVIEFDGLPQTDYALEWTPSLTGQDAVWQPLTIAYREVLGDTADGRRRVRLYADIPGNAPQGFFRILTP